MRNCISNRRLYKIMIKCQFIFDQYDYTITFLSAFSFYFIYAHSKGMYLLHNYVIHKKIQGSNFFAYTLVFID